MSTSYIRNSLFALQFVVSAAIAQPFVAPNPSPGNLNQAQLEVEAKLGQSVSNFREISPGFVAFDLASSNKVSPSQVQRLGQQLPGLAASPRIKRHGVTPNDTLFAGNQNSYFSAGQPGSTKIGEALVNAQGTARTVVAVADTGILPHPELKGRILTGYDFISDVATAGDGDGRDGNPRDEGDFINEEQSAQLDCPVEAQSSWHGTLVSGVIAANSMNNEGITGATYNTQILPVRVLGKCGGFLTDLVDGLRWSAGLAVSGAPNNPNKAKVINLSLGAETATCPAFLQSAVNEIIAAGSVIVASTGNSDARGMNSPANCAGVISVGANTLNGAKSSFSNYAPGMTISTFGGGSGSGVAATTDIGETVPSGSYGYSLAAGTSFSAPLVSAAVALGLQVVPEHSPATIRNNLSLSLDPYPTVSGLPLCSATSAQGACSCTTSVCGGGLLNAQTYLATVQQTRLAVNANPSTAIDASGMSSVTLSLTKSFSRSTPVTMNGYSFSEVTNIGGLTIENDAIEFTRNGDYVIEAAGVDSSGTTASTRFVVSISNLSSDVTPEPEPTPETPVPQEPAPAAASGGGGGGGGSTGPLGLLFLAAGLALMRRKLNQA